MRKFKPGDEATAIESSGCGGFIKGHTYLLSKVDDYTKHQRLYVEKDSRGSPNGWSCNFFKHPKEVKFSRDLKRVLNEKL